MTLMLVAFLGAVLIGMFTDGSQPRQLKTAIGLAVVLTGLYLVRPYYIT